MWNWLGLSLSCEDPEVPVVICVAHRNLTDESLIAEENCELTGHESKTSSEET